MWYHQDYKHCIPIGRKKKHDCYLQAKVLHAFANIENLLEEANQKAFYIYIYDTRYLGQFLFRTQNFLLSGCNIFSIKYNR